MERTRTPQEASQDAAAIALLECVSQIGIDTCFERVDNIKPCPIGADGLCCKNCSMGPCRLVGKTEVGVCGATRDTVAARNFARAVCAGASAHSDHGRGLAYTLLEAIEGHAPDYGVRDPVKLFEMAGYLDVATVDETGQRRAIEDVARDVAVAALDEFGKAHGHVKSLKRAPAKRQQIWRDLGIEPRSIDREVVELMHRTHMGNDQEAEHILDQALRCALGDGWGGSMLGTDLSDVLFGTPAPVQSAANLGVLREDMV
ncbi:MAG: carbon monoxide dehydrogenase, partial [Chloroflexi bacterium]|nr:carbon monoxide dehydrogenase [Chloroflexota bacterium]